MSEKKQEPTKELLVRRKKQNICTVCLLGDKAVRMFPGVNVIKDPEILSLLEDKRYNQGWNDLLKSGVHEIITGKKEGSKTEETTIFTAMTAEKAIEVIKDTYSIPALEQMKAEEQSSKDRKSVANAIDDQISYLKSDDAGK